jgi:hypothetical protein
MAAVFPTPAGSFPAAGATSSLKRSAITAEPAVGWATGVDSVSAFRNFMALFYQI